MFRKKQQKISTDTAFEQISSADIPSRRPSLIYSVCALLIILTLVFNYTVSGMYARYITSTTATEGARVASYAFDVSNKDSGSFELDMSYIVYPGQSNATSHYINITVTNGNSETAQSYKITADDMGNLPIKYAIMATDSYKPKIAEGEGTLASGLPESGGTTSVAGTFPAGVSSTHTYSIRIYWTQAEDWQKLYELSEEIEYITVSVTSEQID